ncbi:hypothetical protein F5144DRAFT_639680 [Chaetomium tenue]|uniref:Uncharacterized protein n=1 Tax=Chaetomium tenue TaxID=1854479 RepID=A0ACB7PKC9_9PEZI|nr:hypothetical protein F5144DRAFT_639680 [Chaetomium globosum]
MLALPTLTQSLVWAGFMSPALRAADDTNVAKVKQAHDQTQDGPPLLWPPLPHDLLGVDILASPFSSSPADGNYPAWQQSLETATAEALEPWLRPGVGNKELHDAAEIASLCLRRPELLSVYLKLVQRLTEGWLPWYRAVTRDSSKRWMVLGEICGWGEQGEGGSDGSGGSGGSGSDD